MIKKLCEDRMISQVWEVLCKKGQKQWPGVFQKITQMCRKTTLPEPFLNKVAG